MGIQVLTARLGVAIRKGVAQLCRRRLSGPAIVLPWAVAELAMVATNTTGITGAATGFGLVFSLSPWAGSVLAAISSFILLGIRTTHERGFR